MTILALAGFVLAIGLVFALLKVSGTKAVEGHYTRMYIGEQRVHFWHSRPPYTKGFSDRGKACLQVFRIV